MNKLSFTRKRLKTLKSTKPKLKKLTTAAIVMTMFGSVAFAPLASADTYDAQINALQQQNNNSAAAKQALQATGESLASRVASLQASIADTESQIATQQAKSDEIQRKMTEIEAELAQHRLVLGASIKQMYFDDQMTTLEKVASSKNWNQFADKEQQNITVKNKIKKTVDEINKLKKQQEQLKLQVDKILSDQKARRTQLAVDQAEANRLLSLNQAQQAEYDQAISANSSKISELQRQQAIVNGRGFVGYARIGGTGGYPWAGVGFPNSLADPWGMYKRQCVSYAAWKVASSGRAMPYWGGRGNANQWDDNARASGIPVDGNPRVGDVAVSNAGSYGHVMYVEAVNGDGTIYISQYNAGWDGLYSVGTRSTAGLLFIHF